MKQNSFFHRGLNFNYSECILPSVIHSFIVNNMLRAFMFLAVCGFQNYFISSLTEKYELHTVSSEAPAAYLQRQ